jgi:hypothetical protein
MGLARPLVVVVAVGLIAAPSSGCSMLFAKGAPTRVEAGQEINCSRSPALPVLDGVVAGLEVARTALAISAKNSDYASLPYSRPVDIAVGGGMAIMYALSSGVGWSRVSSCNELLAKVGPRPGAPPGHRLVAPAAGPPQWTSAGAKVRNDDEDRALEAASVAQARARAKAAAAADADDDDAPSTTPPSTPAPSTPAPSTPAPSTPPIILMPSNQK